MKVQQKQPFCTNLKNSVTPIYATNLYFITNGNILLFLNLFTSVSERLILQHEQWYCQKNSPSHFIAFLIQVWDVISNQEAVQIVSSTPDRAKSAKRLVECAVHAWKRKRQGIAIDDISAICLFFHPSASSLQVHPVTTQEQ